MTVDIAEQPSEEIIASLAKKWNLDYQDLARVVSLARIGCAMFSGNEDNPKPGLVAIAEAAEALVAALEQAPANSIVFMMMPRRVDPYDLHVHTDTYRHKLLHSVKWMAEAARAAADNIKVTNAPRGGRTAPPSALELGFISPLADLYYQTHGEWAHVTDHKSTGAGRRANKAGKFVLEGARAVGLIIGPPRLRTVLTRIERQRQEIAENAAT